MEVCLKSVPQTDRIRCGNEQRAPRRSRGTSETRPDTGGAINQDMVIIPGENPDKLLHNIRADDIFFGRRCRKEKQIWEKRGSIDSLVRFRGARYNVRQVEHAAFRHAEHMVKATKACVAVNHKHALAACCKCLPQASGDGGFPDSAFSGCNYRDSIHV